MRYSALLMTACLIWQTACTKTVVVEKPTPVLVPVAPPPSEPCVHDAPPVRPLDVFEGCVMPEIVACLTRTSLEAVTQYLIESEAWGERTFKACGPVVP